MANSIENFAPVFNKQLEKLFVERMDGNEEIFVRLMNDEAFRNVAAFDAGGLSAGEGESAALKAAWINGLQDDALYNSVNACLSVMHAGDRLFMRPPAV